MYDFVDLSRDITATPFPSDILQVSLRSYGNNGEYARNILSCLQRFAHDKNLKVDCRARDCSGCWKTWNANANVLYGSAMCELRHRVIARFRRQQAGHHIIGDRDSSRFLSQGIDAQKDCLMEWE